MVGFILLGGVFLALAIATLCVPFVVEIEQNRHVFVDIPWYLKPFAIVLFLIMNF